MEITSEVEFSAYAPINYRYYERILMPQEEKKMKATGIVRRIDDLGRVVIPKEIRRTMRIREGDPSQMTLTGMEAFVIAMLEFGKRRYIGIV